MTQDAESKWTVKHAGSTRFVEIVEGDILIANVWASTPEEAIENANTMAAAPEMRDALDKLLYALSQVNIDKATHVGDCYRMLKAIHKAQLALADAKGETAESPKPDLAEATTPSERTR